MLSSFFDFIGDVGGSLFSTDGKLDPGKLAGIAALLGSPGGFNLAPGLFGRPDQPVGYQGSVPNYTAVRRRVPITNDPNRRPGSGGRRYFTDMQYATTPESKPITLEEAQAAAEKQVEELSLAQTPKGISSVIPSTAPPSSPIAPPAPASAVIENMPVPTFSAKPIPSSNDIKMGTGSSIPPVAIPQQNVETPRTQGRAKASTSPASAVIETMPVPTFSAMDLIKHQQELLNNPEKLQQELIEAGVKTVETSPSDDLDFIVDQAISDFQSGKGGTGSSIPYSGGIMESVMQQNEETPRIGMSAGGIASAQEQARKDAEALGITIDEYYALPLKERLGLAAKDIKELADPSLGDARNLGILSLPKPKPTAPTPEITQENLPKYQPPAPQETTTANRPESLTLEDQIGINRGRMTTYPTGAGIGPEMRNEDFMSQLELILQGVPKDTTIPPATYQGRGAPPKPPKPKIGDFKGSLNKDNAFRKRQKERREWDKKYGDMYNDDGTLKINSEGILEQLLQILGGGFGRGVNKDARGLAKGGMLDGATDGMADKVPAMIDGEDPAALSDGEYVITADVVGHLGNGNSDAGAKVLDDFMGDVRMARTGTKKQAPEINPQKFLPKV
jgi:hypothetical protein